MDEIRFNIIRAAEARELVKHGYPRQLYIKYMRELDNKIRVNSEEEGLNSLLTIAPDNIIKDKVYKELKLEGYILEEVEDMTLKITW